MSPMSSRDDSLSSAGPADSAGVAMRLGWQAAAFVGSLALTLLGLTGVTFFIGRLIRADPVLAVVGDHATREVYDKARLAMGLDRPVVEQYLLYLKKVISGDFGHSVITFSILSSCIWTKTRFLGSW